MTAFYISAFLILVYLILIVLFIRGWERIPVFETETSQSGKATIAVVVACKNEEENLYRLLMALQLQTDRNFQIILINDHSTDDTKAIMHSFMYDLPNLFILDAVGQGKKNALKEGILRADAELIITTDADCVPHHTWIKTISDFQEAFPSDLIVGPVKMKAGNTFFSTLQQLEFTSLVASGAGAAGAGMPIMCNGANLAFTKKAWLESQNDLHQEQLSGDDVFLMQSIKKRKGTIRFLKSEGAIVETSSSPTLTAFFKQRKRWTSKAPAYKDWQIILTACSVFSVSALQVTLFVFMFFRVELVPVFFAVFLSKYATDVTMLWEVRNFFRLRKVFLNALLLSLFYPFYIVVVALSGFTGKQQWK